MIKIKSEITREDTSAEFYIFEKNYTVRNGTNDFLKNSTGFVAEVQQLSEDGLVLYRELQFDNFDNYVNFLDRWFAANPTYEEDYKKYNSANKHKVSVDYDV
jgi:hypothetical protein